MGVSSSAASVANKFTAGQQANITDDAWHAINAIWSLQPPNLNDLTVQLQGLVQQGVLSPEEAKTFFQQGSAYNNISPEMQNAQLGSMRQLQDIANTKGLDPQAKAALYQLQSQTNENARGQREANLQNASARGIQGSGIETANAMLSNQGAAQALAGQGYQAAADANNRNLQAIQGVSQIGGQIYGQESQKAAAENAINQFNTQNRQSVENMNVQGRNAAAAANLAEKQRIADTNSGISNQNQLYNSQMAQQNWGNQLARGQALSNANLGAAGAEAGIASQKAAPINAEAAKWSDKRLKKDIEEFDADQFLDKITGYKYKYKKAEHGKGEHIGVMAQDVEKVHPKAVENHPEGKKVNYAELAGPALASLSHMHKRIKKLEGKKDA